ncbi:MAG: zinc ABC transporter substrate-binding protein [Christensenellaceae bacterium]|nr:zinc ABC transporter substrate-binding protein [Christensenellaceae bacterium]
MNNNYSKRPVIRLFAILIAVMMMCLDLSGCGNAGDDRKGISVVCTIFPIYDWTKTIIGDDPGDIELTLLLDEGVDLHSFQPSADDILKISSCDIFIYVGGESDKWTDDILSEASNKDMKVISLVDILGENALAEELKEGMQQEEQEEEEAPDEHVWLSLRNAALFADSIADALSLAYPENSKKYEENKEIFEKALTGLDERFKASLETAKRNTLLFADRFPFRYLTEDYGLDYYAAFTGCSAETEASFETIAFLSDKINELSLDSVIVLEGSDGRIAETVIRDSGKEGVSILRIDSMQSVDSKDIAGGADYLTIMEHDLDVIKKALGIEVTG